MACARLAAELALRRYSPLAAVPAIEAPALFVASRRDALCPFDKVEAAARAAKRGSLIAR